MANIELKTCMPLGDILFESVASITNINTLNKL